MNKTLKNFLCFLLCLSTALSLAACGKENGESAQTPESGESSYGDPRSPEAGGQSIDGDGETIRSVFLPLSINEVMASNKSTLSDAAGLFPDWVELYHYGSEPLSLEGLYLCCGNDRWPLPSLVLEPDSYLVLLCGGKGEEPLRASFSIAREGAVLTLENSDRAVIERLELPATESDESVVRDSEGKTVLCSFPTPGYVNSPAGYAAFQSSLRCDSPLQIEELMVYNAWYYARGGAYYDWVSLKNVSGEELSLSDYFLSDKGSERNLYRLPEKTLAPGESVLIYCTGDAALDFGAPFALSADRDQLFLSRSDGTLCDFASLHDIPYRGSYGRLAGQTGFFYFAEPSPEAENLEGCRSVAQKPTLLGSDGVYNGVENVTVMLSSEGEIHYTTDGTLPTAESPIYSEPLTLSRTGVLRAVTVQEGLLNSEPLDLSYILNEEHTLPVVSLVGDPTALITRMYKHPDMDIEVLGSVALFEENSSFHQGCGVKLHGETSKMAQSKKSFRLNFRSRYDGQLHYDLFSNGILDFSSILLRAAQESTYSTQMRDNIAHQLALQCFPELPAQDYKYAVLYINGEYWGLYNIREAHSATHYANHFGYNEESVTQWKESWDGSGPMGEVYRYAMTHDLSKDEHYEVVAARLNIDSIIGWTILQAWTGNTDCQPPNLRFYYSTEDNRMAYALVDLDLGMFSFDLFDIPINGPVAKGYRYSYAYNDLVRRLMLNKGFQLKMAEQLSAALQGPMSNDNVLALIDSLADEIRPEIQRDRDRWPKGGGDTVDFWEHGGEMVDSLRTFVTRRSGRAVQVINSFLTHSDLTAEEKEFYFGKLLNP